MAFCITFGTTDFNKQIKGMENVTAQCHNCGNWSATPGTNWPWFTVCFVPILPLGSKRKEIQCRICRFTQDLQNRPDVQSQMHGGGPPPHGFGGAPPAQGYAGPNQGWAGGPPPPQQPQRYK